MKIACYGRYSSDSQRETSLADQRRIVQRWADGHHHDIVATYTDAAVSGANAKLQTGLQKALQAACSDPAPFEALVVDQLSRLSRDVGETDTMIKRLKFAGIRVIALSDGIDTAEETTKISVTVKSLVNELYLDDLRKTTKRGLDGQFLKGYSTGGRTFGYGSEPVYDATGKTDPRGGPIPVGYRLAVDLVQASIVRRIFQRFTDGQGEKAIAKELNAQQSGRTWRANTIYSMLRNPKYAGQLYFNRREWRKNPETGRRVSRLRPREHWECRQMDTLRIIDQEIWQAVQHRLQTRPHLFSRGRTTHAHLLSGLLVCDRCGGRFTIVAKDYYGCRNRVESGTCRNELRIRREAIEQVVIGALAQRLPDYIETLRAAATRRTVQRSDQPSSHHRHRVATLRKQAEAVMTAVRHGRLSGRALEEALTTYQQVWHQVEELERSTASSIVQPQSTEIRYDRAVVEDFVAHLPEALRTDAQSGREFLRETLVQVRVANGDVRPLACPVCAHSLGKLTPQHMQKHGLTLPESYRRFPQLGFSRRARLKIQPSPEGILQNGKVFGVVVAGEGFEPSTFGL